MIEHGFQLGVSSAGSFELFQACQGELAEISEELAVEIRKLVDDDCRLITWLGGEALERALPPTLTFWRHFAKSFFSRVCALKDTGSGSLRGLSPLSEKELESLLRNRPLVMGSEYIDEEMLNGLWKRMQSHVEKGMREQGIGVLQYLKALNTKWHQIGRVCFHLAENKADDSKPFAFLATYTTAVTESAREQHRPLGVAMREMVESNRSQELSTLLEPVNRSAANSLLVHDLVTTKQIFKPLFWTAEEAFRFLRELPLFERAGIALRVPDWWNMRREIRPKVEVTIGEQKAGGFGVHAMMGFSLRLSLGDQYLSEEEWQKILDGPSGLVRLKGQWIELDRDKLDQILKQWSRVRGETDSGVSLLDAMRLLAGFPRFVRGQGRDPFGDVSTAEEWVAVKPGEWLREVLKNLRDPESFQKLDCGSDLKATLRPYQEKGVAWLHFASQLGFGVCLADDMGLGKTVQVLAFLLLLKREGMHETGASGARQTLLIVPASLIGNWLAEGGRFAPSLSIFCYHPSVCSMEERIPDEACVSDVVLTTYGVLTRNHWMTERKWRAVILDEAQNIKNPSTRQTQAVKEVNAAFRLAMTGTPVENRLADLWSIFDFLTPGLLGSGAQFARFLRGAETDDEDDKERRFGTLREVVKPYILRRLKTDKSIISDLPDKVEMNTWCNLSVAQAQLYKKSVEELARVLKDVDQDMQRRGLVLSFLMRFKQICNHPSQWIGDGIYRPQDSGKFVRLKEICEEIASRQERVLIFTQFAELTGVLSVYLKGIFGTSGHVLTGSTPVPQRMAMVEDFQGGHGAPFFVLSLKAGGTGLNLTAASHVIHFDRWWNPAIENQATDRAFRIGQKRSVMVHKFVCRGTIEERVDKLIAEKRLLSEKVLGAGAEIPRLTEMSDEEILAMVGLDRGGLDVEES